MFQKQICLCLTKYSQNLRKMLPFFYPQSGAKTSQTWGNNGTPAKLTPHRVLENFFRGTRQDNIILKWYLAVIKRLPIPKALFSSSFTIFTKPKHCTQYGVDFFRTCKVPYIEWLFFTRDGVSFLPHNFKAI